MTQVDISHDRELGSVLLLLAPAITIVVASEFIVVGLLPLIAADVGVSLTQAGMMTAIFALSAAVVGPAITLAATRYSHRSVLVAALVLFAAMNAVIAFSTDFYAMLAARAAQGAILPAFISVGADAVTKLAPPEKRGRALANANIGFVLGLIFALPAGLVLAKGGNWRLPFEVLTVLPIAMAVLFTMLFPAIGRSDAPSLKGQLGLLRQPAFLGHLALTIVLFGAMFSAYTYLAAWLENGLGLSITSIAIALFVFSLAGMIGNNVAAAVADKKPLQATAVGATFLVVAVNVAAFVHGSLIQAAIPLLLWSVTHTALVTLSQVRVTMAGGKSAAFAMTLNISTANLGIAVGTMAGGKVLDSVGVNAIGWAPAGFLAAILVLALLLAQKRSKN